MLLCLSGQEACGGGLVTSLLNKTIVRFRNDSVGTLLYKILFQIVQDCIKCAGKFVEQLMNLFCTFAV